MKDNIGKVIKWVWTKQKAVLLTAIIFLAVTLLKKLLTAYYDDFDWFYVPMINFLKLIKIIALLFVVMAIVNQIKYIGSVLVSLLMTFTLLVFIEAFFCAKYEWKHRPDNAENLRNEIKEKKLKASIESAKQQMEINRLRHLKPEDDPQPTAKTIQNIDLFNVADSERVAGAPSFRLEDAPYGDRQLFDTNLGFVNKPNSHVEIKTWSYGKQNAPSFYTTDLLGRRVSGIKTGNNPNKKYALFFGCSVTFGLLVNDNQTLPAFFEGMDTNYHAYNYGVSGYGAHSVLALLESRNLRKEIPEKDGIAIYSYFIGHTQRAIGDMDSYLNWNAASPYYYLDGDEVVRNKSFKDGRRLVSWFYEFINKTYFGKYFNLKFPGELKPRHYELVAKIIEKAFVKYKEQFGNNKFYVVLLPGWKDEMKPYLDKLHLTTIDCNNLVANYWMDKYNFTDNGHPRPLFYELLAERVHKEILKK